MKRTNILLITFVAATACIGCGERVAWVIRPVQISEALSETVFAADPGLFVADKIVVLDVDGLLVNKRRSLMLGGGDNPVALFLEKIDRAAADRHVKAVIVRINSPGGGVTASDIMHSRLAKLKAERKIPIVAIIQDVGASGGYYVACAADKIIAHPTSVTGSIGVIIQTISLAGTLDKIGVDAQAVTSGPRKDLANPLKPLDEADLAILQGIVDEYYQRFLAIVAKSRTGIDADRLKALADGRVYTGAKAAELGLVDELGYMDDAIAAAKDLAGVTRAKMVMYHRPLGHKPHAYAAAGMPSPQVNLLNINAPDLASLIQPRFMYLWTGRSYGQ